MAIVDFSSVGWRWWESRWVCCMGGCHHHHCHCSLCLM